MEKSINIIKIGTNVITNKDGGIDKTIIEHLVEQVSEIINKGEGVVMISSGAVGAGKEICPEFLEEKNPSVRKRMLAAVGQASLIQTYSKLFKKKGITIGLVLVQRRNLIDRKPYVDFRDTLHGLIEKGIVPIINENDVTTPQEWQFGENDHLATIVAIALKANKLLLCTDVEGLYTDDPRLNKKAKKLDEVQSITKGMQLMAKKSSSGVGLGGMMSKVQAVKLATDAAIESFIINGKKKNNIIKTVFKFEKNGTKFTAKQRDLKTYQRWLAAGAHTYGKIYIDNGAEKALRKRKSLLMVGIENAKGDFKKGDVVDIVNSNEEIVGVGMTNYSRRQIKTYLHKEERSNIKEVVHCDNLVLM